LNNILRITKIFFLSGNISDDHEAAAFFETGDYVLDTVFKICGTRDAGNPFRFSYYPADNTRLITVGFNQSFAQALIRMFFLALVRRNAAILLTPSFIHRCTSLAARVFLFCLRVMGSRLVILDSKPPEAIDHLHNFFLKNGSPSPYADIFTPDSPLITNIQFHQEDCGHRCCLGLRAKGMNVRYLSISKYSEKLLLNYDSRYGSILPNRRFVTLILSSLGQKAYAIDRSNGPGIRCEVLLSAIVEKLRNDLDIVVRPHLKSDEITLAQILDRVSSSSTFNKERIHIIDDIPIQLILRGAVAAFFYHPSSAIVDAQMLKTQVIEFGDTEDDAYNLHIGNRYSNFARYITSRSELERVIVQIE